MDRAGLARAAATIVAALGLLGVSAGAAAQPVAPAHPVVPAAAPLRCPLAGSYDPANPFARILRGEAPVSLIAEDRLVLAFVPIDWQNPGHALIIPRRAVRNVEGLTDREWLAILHMARRIARAQQTAFGSTGYSLQQNNGRNQEVCHAHVHVVPNSPSDPVKPATRAQQDAIAAKLRAALPPL